VDPEEFFQQQFGGEKFVDLIGKIAIARDFQDILQHPEEELAGLTEEEAKKKREELNKQEQEVREKLHKERVEFLSTNLKRKLDVFVHSDGSPEAAAAFREIQVVEAQDLKQEAHGVELLHAIGYTYTLKSQQALGRDQLFGLGKFFNQVREKGHIFSETVSTIRTAVDLQRAFAELQQAEKDGNVEDKIRLEQKATQQGLQALWKGSKLEVQSVLREVCDRVLWEETVSREVLKKRAVALKIIGDVYESVKPLE
jgi:hypothetical protein